MSSLSTVQCCALVRTRKRARARTHTHLLFVEVERSSNDKIFSAISIEIAFANLVAERRGDLLPLKTESEGKREEVRLDYIRLH